MNTLDWLFGWTPERNHPRYAEPVMARWGEKIGVARFRGVWTIPSPRGDALCSTPDAWTPLLPGSLS